MALKGVITMEPRLTRDECIERIRGFDALVPYPPRDIVNPFTRQPATVMPQPGEVQIVVDGVIVGAIELSPNFDEDSALDVYAPESEAKERSAKVVAEQLAGLLGASLQWFDD